MLESLARLARLARTATHPASAPVQALAAAGRKVLAATAKDRVFVYYSGAFRSRGRC